MKAVTTLFAALILAAGPARAEDIREVREAQPDGRIDFSAVTGDFTVIGHEAGEFVLEGRLGDDVEALIIEGDASNWRIELEPVNGGRNWGSNGRSSDLTLYVPSGSDLGLGTVSGDMSIRDLSGPALDVESVSGDLELENIKSSEVDVETVSGDVAARDVTGREHDYQSVSGDLEVSGARGRIDIETVSGRIKLDAGTVDDFESETVSGDLEARLSAAAGASLNVTSHSGDMTLEVRVDGTPRIRAESYSGRIESDFGRVEEAGFGPGESLNVDGDADAVEIEARSFSGSVTLRRVD